ncbi:MAG: Coenzyme F420 hydrogenase/dehydrogenase, beta subunit C-terminal domain, partial [Chloroflexota bacterium]
VLALGRTGTAEHGVAYSLFTDPDAFAADGDALPLLPFMPANGGGLLSRLTLEGALTGPVAAVIRPCELRAFIELMKLSQGSLDNVFLISTTCGGVYPLETAVDGSLEERLPGYWDGMERGELDEAVRPTCRACERFVPTGADVTVALLGETDLDGQCTLYLNTERGAAFAGDLEGTAVAGEAERAAIEGSQAERDAFREEFFAGVDVGLRGLIHTFGRCIGCHGCKTVCPVCYCELCHFDSHDCEREVDYYEGELRRKGGTRVPPDTVFFQLGRMAHMAISCVGCGMCTDVCPADIPVSTIFAKVAASAQATFDYEPGRDVAEEIPLRTFREEELAQVAT